MQKQDIQNIKRYLYSIKKAELAVLNLEKAMEELETHYNSPPSWVRDMDATCVSGNSREKSKQEAWVQFLEYYPIRKTYLEEKLGTNRKKIGQYYSTLELMAEESHWGALGVQIIKYKYYQRMSPDKSIYTMFLFCTSETFYRTHRRALKFFHDVLSEYLRNDNVETGNNNDSKMTVN